MMQLSCGRRSDGISLDLSPKARGPGALMSSVLGQKKDGSAHRENSPFLCIFVLLRPSTDCMVPTHIERAICYTRFTNSDANFFWKHAHKHS